MSIARVTGRWVDRRLGRGGGKDSEQPFEALTTYIPVETITLFVSAVSVLSALAPGKGKPVPFPLLAGITIVHLYWVFACVLTPLIVLLLALAKQRKADPAAAFRIPWWPMIAAVIAFLAWAWAVPGLAISDAEKVLAAFAATFISRFLSMLEGIFG